MRVISLDINQVIVGVKNVNNNYVLQENEIETNLGELGQTRNNDGTFINTSDTLDEVKEQKLNELQQSYYASFVTFQSNALGTIRTYPFDLEAQNNLRDYQNRMIADPNKDNFYFKTIEDATLVLHNRVQFLQLMEDAEMFKVNQTIKINDLINQVNAATTKVEVDTIAW